MTGPYEGIRALLKLPIEDLEGEEVKSLPVDTPFPRIANTDPRTQKRSSCYMISINDLTETEWEAIFLDMRRRFKDSPPTLELFKDAILKQGGMPLREDRVTSTTFPTRLIT